MEDPKLPLQPEALNTHKGECPPGKANRLIHESSPYLLQHAFNPVDWLPWGKEALDLSRQQDKPIFLSIGYSTCHWCHVMERESFEDPEVARELNSHFICIKVDKEERPDIDSAYMSACQLMTGSGGWPLTLLLTPDRKPFFAATYLPKRSSMGRPGLMDVLAKANELWARDKAMLLDGGTRVVDTIQRLQVAPEPPESLDPRFLRETLRHFSEGFDNRYGGFGKAPKFPTPVNLSLLLRLSNSLGRKEAAEMALHTLESIRKGGIYDQIGFGMHRYATDRSWHVPHFEKMLYDQALMILTCVDAFQISGTPLFSETVCEIIEYLNRDLAHPEGGFYCAEDADSQGSEGTFYLWPPAEVEAILDKESAELFCACFDITAQGNWEGENIPNLTRAGRSLESLTEKESALLMEARKKLLAARGSRPRPHRDDKILSGWNGLALAALSRAAFVLNRSDWLQTAEKTAAFVLKNLRRPDGRLLRSFRQGTSSIPAFVEDYAFLCWGLLELYLATFEPDYLQRAMELSGEMDRLFRDGSGAFRDTGRDAEIVLTEGGDLQDGALPSGAATATLVQLRLARLCGDQQSESKALETLQKNLSRALQHPMAHAQTLLALDEALHPGPVVVLCAGQQREGIDPLLQPLRARFLPGLSVHVIKTLNRTSIDNLSAWTRGKEAAEGAATAWLCTPKGCRPPTTDPAALGSLLDEAQP